MHVKRVKLLCVVEVGSPLFFSRRYETSEYLAWILRTYVG